MKNKLTQLLSLQFFLLIAVGGQYLPSFLAFGLQNPMHYIDLHNNKFQ